MFPHTSVRKKTFELNTKVCIYMLKTSALVFFLSRDVEVFSFFFKKSLPICEEKIITGGGHFQPTDEPDNLKHRRFL